MLKNKVTYGQHLTYSDNYTIDPLDVNYGVDLDTSILLRALRVLPGDGAHILENRPPTAEEVAQAPIFAYVPAGCTHDWSQREDISHTMIPRDANFHNGELPDHLYWEVENELADCYPLPDFEKHLTLPLFDEDAMNIPVNKGGLSQISDEYYTIWSARFAQQQSVALLGQRVGLSDLWRYWMLLRGAHKQLHVLLDKASTDPGSLVLGNYLALSIYHAGVESLMRDTKNQLMKYYPMRG